MIKIEVTEADFEAFNRVKEIGAVRLYTRGACCPVAQAIRRVLPTAKVYVNNRTLRLDQNVYPLPDYVIAWVDAFDLWDKANAGLADRPELFSFEMEL